MVVRESRPARFGWSTNKTAVLLILLGVLVQAPAQAATSAWVSYQACCEDSPTGFYERNEHVFFVAEVEITSKNRKRLHWEGKAMLEVGRLLRQYLVRGVENIGAKEIPFDGPIRERIEQLLDENRHASSAVKNLRTRILVNKPVERVYRYVVTAKKADLEQQRGSVTTNARDIAYLVRLAFADAKENEKYFELAAFYLELGLVEDALFYRNAQLSADYHLVNYFWPRDPYRIYTALRGFTSDRQDGSVPDFDLLYELPGNYQLLSDLVSYKLIEDPLASAVGFLTLLPDSDGDKYAASLADLNAQLSRLDSYHQNFAEYIEMLGRLADLRNTEDTVFHQSPLLRLTLKTFGHLKMAGDLPSDANHYFEEAHTLFTAGREPERIKQLLVLSLTESPRHVDSWEHLAALLFWQKKVEEALIAYTQLYQLDNSNLETMAHIAECYDRLDFKGLSRSYAEHLPILNQDIGNDKVTEIINHLSG